MNKIKGKTLIGITGGIGSGKSEVCAQLQNKGFTVFFADLLAKELYTKDKKLSAALVKRFGKDILNFKGKINLLKLKEAMFKSKKNYNDCNNIVHPVVINYLAKQIRKTKEKMILIESAILFESNFDKYLDFVVMVYSNKKTRMKRIMMRDGAKRKEIETVMKYQMDERKKIDRSDIIIMNNKNMEGFSEQIDYVGKLLSLLEKN
ncbi:MAG TPA: dephospho-CoA kinase [Ignavibacteria bacterium]|nr:dephospho-CoA kinase [Ignavibacteria bacterium]